MIKKQNLTRLENVKGYLGVSTTADDDLFEMLIRAASDFIRSYLGRDITLENYIERLNGMGTNRMVMKNYPITAITSLTIDGTNIPAAADSRHAGYLFDADMIYLVGFRFNRGFQNVVVNYTAGYISVPAAVEQACIDLAALKYKEKERIGIQSKTLATETVVYKLWDLTESSKNMLGQYIRRTPV